MNFGHIVEGALWRKYDQEVTVVSDQLRSRLANVPGGESKQTQCGDLLIEAYSAVSTQGLSAARGTWLMSGRTEEKKVEQLALLQSKLERGEADVLAVASEALSTQEVSGVQEAIHAKLYGVRISALSEFKNLEDPLEKRAARPMSGAGTGYNPRTKVLFLTADPSRTRSGQRPGAALNLDVEFRDVSRAIQSSRFRDQIELEPVLAATKQDLLNALNSRRPRIVHFSGHGMQSQGIVLLDENGRPAPVGSDFLASVFTSLSSDIRLVALNACHSEDQARAISNSVPVTVGTEKQIGDEAAVAFSAAFYSALANGLSTKQAFDQGSAMLAGVSPHHAPRMMIRSDSDPSKQRFARDPDRDDFEPLATALSSSIRAFLNRPKELKDLLAATGSPEFKAGVIVGSPITKDQAKGLLKIRKLIDQDRERARDYGETLDGIGRRWSRHLSDAAVGKFTRLEQAVGTYVSDIRAYTVPVLDAIDFLAEQLEGSTQWTSPHVMNMETLIRTLDSLARFLDTAETGIRVAYNLMIELLPGDLVARGLLRAV